MKLAVLDITGRNPAQYNPALCNSISKIEKNVTLLAPSLQCKERNFRYFHLFNLMPKSWVCKETKAKRLLRVFEVFLNYIIVWFYLIIERPDVLHLQWLPFLEFSSVESYFLKLYSATCSHTRKFLTVHNVFPHNLNDKQKKAYHKRFLKIDKYFVGYLVHLESSKKELNMEFAIRQEKIHVAYHGIYVPSNYDKSCTINDGKLHIIMYGYQTKYKGADILVDALRLMSINYLNKVDIQIVGKTENNLLKLAKSDLSTFNVHWNPSFVLEEELYRRIGESNLILLPYRAISQSGVLLLALSFRKPIATSNLPSFKETLDGYDSDWFFESENPKALSEMLIKYIDGRIDISKQIKIIDNLNKKYAWENTARSTIEAYKNC